MKPQKLLLSKANRPNDPPPKDRKAPSWLEVSHSGIKTLVGQFVADGGSARPISEVFHNNGKFHFAIPAQWENTNMDHIVEGTVNGDSMSGTLVT